MSDRDTHPRRGKSAKRRLASHPELLPSAEFTERLLGRLREEIRIPSAAAPSSRWRSYIRVRIPLAAAGLLIVFGCLWVFFGSARTASADFGDMLRHIRQAATVAFTVSIQRPGETPTILQVRLNKAGQVRQEYSDGDIHIIDTATGNYLRIIPSEKRAVYRSVDANSLDASEPLNVLLRMADSAGEYVRNETYQGRRTAVYRAPCDDGEMTIWVDPEEELPVRMERRYPPLGDLKEMLYVLDNFQWDPPIPESQFSQAVPEGYRLERPEQDATEEDMIYLFRYLGEKDGEFPADVQRKTLITTLLLKNDSIKMREAEDGTFISDVAPDMKQILRRCYAGMAFIRNCQQTGRLQYLGNGASMGDSSAVVCYWDSPDGSTFRVIYGDLTVQEYPSEEKAGVLQNNHGRKESGK